MSVPRRGERPKAAQAPKVCVMMQGYIDRHNASGQRGFRTMAASKNSFGARDTLTVGKQNYEIHRLEALDRGGIGLVGQLPFSARILLENLLRQEDGRFVHAKDIEALAEWQPVTDRRAEIAFMPARVLLQDFTGVPAVADLAAMRDAIEKMGGDAKKINPLLPAELLIDHSAQVDKFGSDMAFAFNAQLEFQRNGERYQFPPCDQ